MIKKTLSEQIASQLEAMIADGSLQPGEQLPAERILSERLGVSRPSLREAIKKLASKGLLMSRQGGGTYAPNCVGRRSCSAPAVTSRLLSGAGGRPVLR